MNTRGTSPYVITQKGGTKGGGTQVTPRGKLVMKAYSQLVAKLDAVVSRHSEVLKSI
jgi:molybdate transport system regulatory protein